MIKKSTISVVLGSVLACAGCAPLSGDELPVGYLDQAPEIDGQLDPIAAALPAQSFSRTYDFDNPEVEPVEVSYRLGYSDTHLYLFIQTSAESITEHRRGWLWGDGYKLTLIQPDSEAPSPHFYELGFSPNSNPAYRRLNQIIMTHNQAGVWRDFSNGTRSAAAPNEGGTGFEAWIAWEDIPPYHPWLSNRLGINLYFAKAFFDEVEGQFPNGFAITHDEGTWDESLSERAHAGLMFEPPVQGGEMAGVLRAEQGRIIAGESISVRLALSNAPEGREIALSLANGSGSPIATVIASGDSLERHQLEIATASLAPGDYRLQINGFDAAPARFIVLPDVDLDAIAGQIAANPGSLPDGVMNTLLFRLEQYRDGLATRPAYEYTPDLLEDWTALQPLIARYLSGEDPFADLRTPYRRAFRSDQDGSLQPYSINLPEDYDPERAYPLLVFLHGSGATDEGLLDQARSNGAFIEIAPLGRDIYEAYARDISQRDILEAIADARAHFPIDENAILIGGFSMGGYGALRTYYETPELYGGVAVFAGHPNLANEWLDGLHPNFLEADNQRVFADVPVFIYHGEADEALDPDLMRAFGQAVAAAGGDVTTSFVEGRGHRYQDEATNEMYFAWLQRFQSE